MGTSILKKSRHNFALYIGAIVIFAVFSIVGFILERNFFSLRTVKCIIVQAAPIAIIAIGQTMVIITGGIDLSVGSVIGIVGIVGGMLMVAGVPLVLVILIILLMGALLGGTNGVVISYGKVPPFIMTLGMMIIIRGLTLGISGSKPIAVAAINNGFYKMASSEFLGIPIFIFYIAAFFSIMIVVLSKTKFGRYIYSVGGNRAASRLSGVKTNKIETLTYALAGVFSAIGGLMLFARLLYADPNAGSGYEMDTIAAVVLGGVSMSGGQGKLINVLVGALILGTLQSGLQIMNVPTFYQQIVTGLAIVVAVYFDRKKERIAE